MYFDQANYGIVHPGAATAQSPAYGVLTAFRDAKDKVPPKAIGEAFDTVAH